MGGLLILAERVLPQRGGLAVATSRIAAAAAAAGEEVHVLHPSREVAPGAAGRRERDGVILHPVGEASSADDTLFALADHARRLVRTFGIDLVHGIWASGPGYLAAVLGRELGIASLVSIRGNDLERGLTSSLELPHLRFAIECASIVTAVSGDLAQRATRIFARPVEHVTNAVDAERFHPVAADDAQRAELGLSDAPVIGFLGELREKKGMAYLLPAFDALVSRRPASLLLVGGVRADCKAAFERFSTMAPRASEHVHVVEYARDPERLCATLALCDLMVFPSLYDGTPNAVLEAMACGLPILATDAGGQAELIRHGETGAVIPRERLSQLPDAIEEALGLAERKSWGEAARRHVLEFHQPATESAAYAALRARARSGLNAST